MTEKDAESWVSAIVISFNIDFEAFADGCALFYMLDLVVVYEKKQYVDNCRIREYTPRGVEHL